MLSAIDRMPDNARAWLYVSDRAFSEQEEAEVKSTMGQFLEQWTAHGADLKAGSVVLRGQVLLVAVDASYNQASGCSIDKLQHAVGQLEERFGVQLRDQGRVCWFDEQGALKTAPFQEAKALVALGAIGAGDLVVQPQLTTLAEVRAGWTAPAAESWLGRFFKVGQEQNR